jgi:hypothetical protein
LAYRFEDAKTLYESFIRGKNVSGKDIHIIYL